MVWILAGLLAMSGTAFAEDSAGDFPRMSLDQDPPPAPTPEAEESGKPWRTFEFVAGVSYTSVRSTILMSKSGFGASLAVDAENILGMDRELFSPQVWTTVRLAERHRLEFSFEDLTRRSTRTLQKSIDINGVPYSVGTEIHAIYGVQLFNLSYVWSFLQDDRMELGLKFGIDLVRTHLSIESDLPPRLENERYHLPVPLPGLNADFVLIKDLWLRQRLGLMYLPIQNYAGLIVDLNLSIEYSLLKNLSLGLGLDLLRVRLEKTSSDDAAGEFEGKFELFGTGVLFYINFHL